MLNDTVFQNQIDDLRTAASEEELNAAFHAATAIWYSESDLAGTIRMAGMDILLAAHNARRNQLDVRAATIAELNADGSLASLGRSTTLAEFDRAMLALLPSFHERPFAQRAYLVEYYLGGRARLWKTG